MRVKKRDGSVETFQIEKIRKQTIDAINGFGYDPKILEESLLSQIRDGISTEEVQKILISSALSFIDVDVPNWTFVASSLFINNLYHKVGKKYNSAKGKPYSHTLEEYIKYGQNIGRVVENIENGFDLEELNSYLKPERDRQFTYLGVRTLYDRYLLKDIDATPIELPQHMFMAVSMFLASREERKMEKVKEFYDVISKFEVMVATPTLSNARTTHSQLSSCFVGVTADNIESIFDGYKDMALLSKFGGGIGWDYSEIRGSGSSIRGHAGASGGIIPFLKPVNDIANAVDQLGTRKGSINTYLQTWHWDLEDFLELKKNSGEERRRTHDLFISLWINDLFMERIRTSGVWTLFDPKDTPDLVESFGEEFRQKYLDYEKRSDIRKRSLPAKELWKKVLVSYYETGSPFLTFKDEANRRNQNSHSGRIRSSNLCVTGDTRLLTENGYIRADELANSEENPKIVIDKRMVGETTVITPLHKMVMTSQKEKIYRATFGDGSSIKCTGYHEFPILVDGKVEKKKLLDIKDEPIYLHKQETELGTEHLPDDSFVMGVITGDGNIKYNRRTDKNVVYINIYDATLELQDRIESTVHRVLKRKKKLPHFKEQMNAKNSKKKQLISTQLATHFSKYNFNKDTIDRVPDILFKADKESITSYLKGLYSVAGNIHIDGSQHKFLEIQITSKSIEFIEDLKLLFSMLGFYGEIYHRRDWVRFDLKGNYAVKFVEEIGLLIQRSDKVAREIISNLKEKMIIPFRENREWTTKIISCVEIGEEPVYDLTSEPVSNTVIFNGIVTGQCTEIYQNTSSPKYEIEDGYISQNSKQTSGETAVCNLASVNLSKINSREDISRVVPIAIRMLDNVIDLNYYPIESAKFSNMTNRPIGLGVMGEAQMLAENSIHFGSEEHLTKIDEVMENISYEAILSSHNLALEKGKYPNFGGSNWSKGVVPIDTANSKTKTLLSRKPERDWEELKKRVKSGMRNGYLMAIAPTSSISILVGTSQAIEPIYKKKWSEENLSGHIPVTAPNLSPDTWYFYKEAYDVEQLDIVKAGAIRQKWIDQGQSLNIFVKPEKVTGGQLHKIYNTAWELGLKSTYYLRSKSPEMINRDDECLACQ
jgi:ribonucleotide reductase alpha subunit